MTAPLPNLPMPTRTDSGGLRPVLERIAGTTLTHLRQAGYLADDAAALLLAGYVEKLGTSAGRMPDFLSFTAEARAEKHSSLTVEGELARMQKLLRKSLNDRVHQWSFGPLPGRPAALYEHCPGLRPVCMALGCPSTPAGETGIVHVTALNPVSALVASFWVSQELNRHSEGEEPFVFTFFTDLPTWQALMQRHFAS